MSRLAAAALAAAAWLAACGPAPPAPEAVPAAVARRIVSLDYCADQFVLRLADREHILALSPDATASFSYLREKAAGIPQVRPRSEDVLILGPDLVVRSYGGGPHAAGFLRRAGVPVVQIGFAADLDGVRDTVRQVGDALGVPRRAAAVVARMDARLADLARHPTGATALYLTPSGTTTGPGTLVHRMLAAAGLANFQRAPGWRALPLERLAYERPDLVAAADFGARTGRHDAWSAVRHPLVQRRMSEVPVVHLDGAATSCGGWFLVDAVEALAAGGIR